jgi:hypothetical protein
VSVLFYFNKQMFDNCTMQLHGAGENRWVSLEVRGNEGVRFLRVRVREIKGLKTKIAEKTRSSAIFDMLRNMIMDSISAQQ